MTATLHSLQLADTLQKAERILGIDMPNIMKGLRAMEADQARQDRHIAEIQAAVEQLALRLRQPRE